MLQCYHSYAHYAGLKKQKIINNTNYSHSIIRPEVLNNALEYDVFQPSFKGKYLPVKTLHEAENYAQKHLHLRSYKVDDLEVANWLNKGLSHLKEATKSRSTVLNKVEYTSFSKKLNAPPTTLAMMDTTIKSGGIPPFFMTTKSHTLYINKDYFKNIDKFINNTRDYLKYTGMLRHGRNGLKLNDNFTTANSSKYEKLMNAKLHKLSKEEKIDLHSYLANLQDYVIFKQSIVDDSIQKILKNKKYSAYISSIAKYLSKGLDKNTKYKILIQMEKTLGITHDIKIDGKYKILNHEVGHMLHAENDINTYDHPTKSQKYEFQNNIYTIGRVSKYAKESINEFVAETFAKLALGLKMPNDVMKLYYKFGGPKVG